MEGVLRVPTSLMDCPLGSVPTLVGCICCAPPILSILSILSRSFFLRFSLFRAFALSIRRVACPSQQTSTDSYSPGSATMR
jgi:hypothetical protein